MVELPEGYDWQPHTEDCQTMRNAVVPLADNLLHSARAIFELPQFIQAWIMVSR